MVAITRKKRSEQKEQIRFVQYIRTFRPDILIASIPNGAGVSSHQRIKLTQEGMLAGMPDLILLMEGSKTLFIEFKRPDGRGTTSEVQKTLHERLKSFGFEVFVATTCEDALGFLLRCSKGLQI